MQTRYNSFIPELTKKDHYSCPVCYGLTKTAVVPKVTCIHCGTQAPILSGIPVAIPSGIGAFQVIAATASLWTYHCPKCSASTNSSPGAMKLACGTCSTVFPVSYREVCNACLIARNKIVKAEYVCSNNDVRHTTKQPGVAQAGKCSNCRCSYDCKKI